MNARKNETQSANHGKPLEKTKALPAKTNNAAPEDSAQNSELWSPPHRNGDTWKPTDIPTAEEIQEKAKVHSTTARRKKTPWLEPALPKQTKFQSDKTE